MKATQRLIQTGAACGTYVTEVRTNNDELLGFIRVVNIDWTPTLGMSTYFAVHQCNKSLGYDCKMCNTLLDAYHFLGISTEELDNSDLGNHCYDERYR